MKLHDLNEGVQYILGGNYMTKRVPVLQNPSLTQAKQLMAKAPEGILRGMVSTDGELFVWAAHDAEHYETADQLGIEIMDQWGAHSPIDLEAYFKEWQQIKRGMLTGSMYR